MAKIIHHVNVEPPVDDTIDIGSLLKQFRYGYFRRLYVSTILQLPNLDDNPSASAGGIYYNSDGNIVYFDGSEWKTLSTTDIDITPIVEGDTITSSTSGVVLYGENVNHEATPIGLSGVNQDEIKIMDIEIDDTLNGIIKELKKINLQMSLLTNNFLRDEDIE